MKFIFLFFPAVFVFLCHGARVTLKKGLNLVWRACLPACVGLIALETSLMTRIELANAETKPMIFKSGKTPYVEGQNREKDSKDTTGTKKDITFLRCMSNCKTRCQQPSEGPAKIDCVQDCQDQCCFTYEQCSFKVKTNIGNTI